MGAGGSVNHMDSMNNNMINNYQPHMQNMPQQQQQQQYSGGFTPLQSEIMNMAKKFGHTNEGVNVNYIRSHARGSPDDITYVSSTFHRDWR